MDSSSIKAFSDLAASAGRGMNPAVILLGGEEIDATIPTPTEGLMLDLGGTGDTGSLICRILVADLATRPDENQELKWKRPGAADWEPVTWWVTTVKKAEMDVEWRLTCIPKN